MTYESNPDLQDLEDDVVLWRYVDLYRYLDLLQSSELHLTRADQMEDKWEGSFSPLNVIMRAEMYAKHNIPGDASASTFYHFARSHVYLNCWYTGPAESYAMWKLYGSSGKGVAIRTTAGGLRLAIQGPRIPYITGSVVHYADYARTAIPEGNLFFPLVHKRESFSHEREFRLLGTWFPTEPDSSDVSTEGRSIDNPPPHLRVSVDLSTLVEAVYVSPDAPEWVAGVIEDVTSRYIPAVDVRQSDLNADPVY